MSDPTNPPSKSQPSTPSAVIEIHCCDCGNSTTEKLPIGWTWLAVSSRWRCPDCQRVLDEINGYTG